MFGAVDEVALEESPIQIGFRAFTVQLSIDFDSLLSCSLACNRFSHRDNYLCVVLIILRNVRFSAAFKIRLILLFLNDGQVLCCSNCSKLGVNVLLWTGTLKRELSNVTS